MASSLEVTTWDIANFFINENINEKEKVNILKNIWKNRKKYIEWYVYNNFKEFTNEISKVSFSIVSNNMLADEFKTIYSIQDELSLDYEYRGMYRKNRNSSEEYLKQVRLSLDYLNMKKIDITLGELIKKCGYEAIKRDVLLEIYKVMKDLKLGIFKSNSETIDLDEAYSLSINDKIYIKNI